MSIEECRLVKTCPYCHSIAVSYRTRMHLYHCVHCRHKFERPVLGQVAARRTFSKIPLHLQKKI